MGCALCLSFTGRKTVALLCSFPFTPIWILFQVGCVIYSALSGAAIRSLPMKNQRAGPSSLQVVLILPYNHVFLELHSAGVGFESALLPGKPGLQF